MKTPPETQAITWQAPEHEYIEKTPDWFWVVGLGGSLITLGSYLLGNWSFATLMLLSTIVLMTLAKRKPTLVSVRLENKRLVVAGRSYHLSKFDQFNIDQERGQLMVHSPSLYRPLTIIPLSEEVAIETISQFFEDAGLEHNEDLHEPFLEVFLHRLGF